MVKRKAKWTREEMLAAGKHWIKTFGEVPASTDFHPGDCRYSARISFARGRRWMERARRFETGTYPWPRTVQQEFGSWSAFIRELGHQPRKESIPDISRDAPRHDVGHLKALATLAVKAEGEQRRAALYDLIDSATALLDE